MLEINIGVVGYCPPTKFDEPEAERMINEAYDAIQQVHPDKAKIVVSGLTNVGVPAIAYRAAVQRGWKTKGIACLKSNEFQCFPVDEKVIIGTEWGDESQQFITIIDILIRVGGGKQSLKEAAEMYQQHKPVLEYELPALK